MKETFKLTESHSINPQATLSVIRSTENISVNSYEEILLLAVLFYQASSAAIVIMDRDYKILHINPAFIETTGYDLADVTDGQVKGFFDLFNDSSHQEDIMSSVAAEGSWRGELSVCRKAAESFPALALIDSVEQPDGSISNHVGLFLNISDHKQLEQELRQHAEIDSLTGLANRKLFFQRLDDAIASAKRFNYAVALLFLDLDGFKQINDSLGHAQGDTVLIEIAHRLRRCVREVDTVARLGGDEFVLILNGTSKEAISDTARRIIDSTAFTVNEKDISLPISASVGISIYPEDSLNPQTLLKYADAAMYSAKFKGKRQCCWHTY